MRVTLITIRWLCAALLVTLALGLAVSAYQGDPGFYRLAMSLAHAAGYLLPVAAVVAVYVWAGRRLRSISAAGSASSPSRDPTPAASPPRP